jgi:hypothetical protein
MRGLVEKETFAYDEELNNGNSGSAKTINWKLGNRQRITLTGAPCVFTFTNPLSPAVLTLKLIQGSGGSKTVTWPSSVKWVGRTAPTLTTTAAYIDIVGMYFDGTNYYATASLNFG